MTEAATEAQTAEGSGAPPSASEIACSVLMPVLNEEAHIASSVAAMRKQRFPGELEFIVIDGDSEDRTAELLAELAREDPRIRLLRNPRRVTPTGLNIGLAHARGRWVARMDAHTEYPEDYLLQGVERLRQGGTSWVSGPQIPRGRGPVSRAVTLALSGPLGRGGSRKWSAYERGEEIELDSGVFAGVWERETLLRTGGWDERWVRNQDSEMAGRFLAAGERLILLPGMAADYTPRDTLRALGRQYYQYGRFRAMTARRHPHTLRRSGLLPPAVVIDLALAAVGGPRHLRRLARAGGAAYVAALLAAAASTRRQAERPLHTVLVPVVLVTMHLAHGAGTVGEWARSGLPWAALARVLGLHDTAERWTPPPEPVHAPALQAVAAEER